MVLRAAPRLATHAALGEAFSRLEGQALAIIRHLARVLFALATAPSRRFMEFGTWLYHGEHVTISASDLMAESERST